MQDDRIVVEEGLPPALLVTDDMIRNNMLDDADRAWTSDNVERIVMRREAMSGLLFFDILLQLGGIENAQEVFPPSNRDEYSVLLDAIFASSYDNMKRDCLLYYLLKFLMNTSEVRFASQQMLAHHYASLADAYWFLDNGFNLDNAITHLSDVRIIKEYSSKIMDTLALDEEADRLLRRYVRTCSPPLTEATDMTRYLLALAEHSIVEAWEYQQHFPNTLPAKKDLIRNLLTWVLSPKPKQEPLKLLLTMQMTRYEEAIVRDFAERPPEELPPQSASVVRDMVCVRLIQQCKFVDAVKFDRMYPSSGAAPRGTWGTERERIIKEVIAILPTVERRLLESELESIDENAPPATTSSGSSWMNIGPAASSSTADLSASWEDIGKRLPRRSIGRPITGRTPRSSMVNGSFGLDSSNSGLRSQPLSAYPTLISSSSSAPHMSQLSTQPTLPSLPIPSSKSGPAKISVNGTAKPNGTQKTNAFMSRNAFYEPPERSSSPEEVMNISRSPPKARPPEKPELRLPTPPQEDEPERRRTGEESRDESDARSVDGIVDVDDQERTSLSDREDLNYSIFNRQAPITIQPIRQKSPPPLPAPLNASARDTRRSTRLYPTIDEIIEVEVREKSPQISVPGAFVHDNDEEQREHELPSPTSATNTRPALSISTGRRANNAVPTPRRSTRKRAASPAESADGDVHVKISIPGALHLDDDDDDRSVKEEIEAGAPAAHTRAHTRKSNASSRRAGTATDEDGDGEDDDGREGEGDDSIAPLPTQRTRRKAAAAADAANAHLYASPVKSRSASGRGSRAGSLEPETGVGGLDRSLRRSTRSTRVTHASVSPVEEGAERKTSSRPRKSTRTAGAGATATGRGATKRR